MKYACLAVAFILFAGCNSTLDRKQQLAQETLQEEAGRAANDYPFLVDS